jgi:hypothetical protein
VRDEVGKKNKMKNNTKQELATTQNKSNSKHKEQNTKQHNTIRRKLREKYTTTQCKRRKERHKVLFTHKILILCFKRRKGTH